MIFVFAFRGIPLSVALHDAHMTLSAVHYIYLHTHVWTVIFADLLPLVSEKLVVQIKKWREGYGHQVV